VSDPSTIELNDSGILVADASGVVICEPGYARLTPGGIQTGEEAQRHAFLEPQRVYHHYWNQLNLAPLKNAHGQARHHADLAYNQLLQLHQAAGQPQHAVFAVPGTFSRDQLSILLGLAQASPFEAVGLVDSAVAALAGLGETGEWLYLDLHLHQAVLSRVRLGERIERLDVQAIAHAGLRTLLDNWAQHIAHLFVRQYRYDPLHTAAGEQQLYDRMNTWLPTLAHARDIMVELDSQRGTYSLTLPGDSFISSNAQPLQNLRRAIGQQEGVAGLVVSDRIARLPHIEEQLAARLALPADIVTRNVHLRHDQLGPVDGGLVLHTRLPAGPSSATAAPVRRTAPAIDPALGSDNHPTHVLFQHRAHAIGDGLYIGFSGAQPAFGRERPATPWLHLRRQRDGLQWHSEGHLTVSVPTDGLTSGSSLTVEMAERDHRCELVLIEVN